METRRLRSALEINFENELDDAGAACAAVRHDIVERCAADKGVVLTFGRIHGQQVRQRELRVIENIEELRRKFHVSRFAERKTLLHLEIGVVESGSAKAISSRSGERTGLRLNEARRRIVGQVSDRITAGIRDRRHERAGVTRAAGIDDHALHGAITVADRIRETQRCPRRAGGCGIGERDVPSAEQLAANTRAIRIPRQIPDQFGHKSLRHIEDRDASFVGKIAPVLRTARIGEIDEELVSRVVDRLAPSIVRIELKAVAEAVRDFENSRVVTGIADRKVSGQVGW